MKSNRWIVPMIFGLAAAPCLGYHFGEKPGHSDEANGRPVIVRLEGDVVEYRCDRDEPVTLAIYDVRGNLIPNNGMLTQQSVPEQGSGRFAIALPSLPSGVYFITLRNSAGITAVGIAGVK